MLPTVLPLSSTRLVPVVEAWIQDVQSATSQPESYVPVDCRNASLSHHASVSRRRVVQAKSQEDLMNSQQGHADDSREGATLKRCHISIHKYDTPRAGPAQIYIDNLTSHPINSSPNQPSSPSSDAPLRFFEIPSISPINSLGALRMTENPVEYSDNIEDMTSVGRDLYDELDDITIAVGKRHFLHDLMFDRDDALSPDPRNELAQAKNILKRAKSCLKLQVTIPGWNEQVHSRVLELALEDQEAVTFQNITTAKIHPPTFTTKNINGALLPGKLVDYAICLAPNPTEPMSSKMRSTIQLEPTSSQYINHTSYEPLRFQPIAVSIATSIGVHPTEATFQLAVWVTAHFKRLQSIMQRSGASSEMTVLPLVDVQSHEWYVTLATSGESKTTLYDRIHIGGTNTLVGIYQILAALKVLRRWADAVFRPWFDGILVAD